MEILSGDKILWFILFVMPGFLSVKIYELFVPGDARESKKLIFDSVAYSAIVYGISSPALYWWANTRFFEGSLLGNCVLAFCVLFLLPCILPWLFQKIRRSEWILRFGVQHPVNSPWDFVFEKGKPYWTIVTLKNGNKIAGYYGPNSFASGSPAAEGIYLEQNWMISEDGGFERRRDSTAGILILPPDISTVEFFEVYTESESNHERQEHP